MRLTKGQLKQIIREEYTRLRRQGLIRESRNNNPVIIRLDELTAGGMMDYDDVERLGMQLADEFSVQQLLEAEEKCEMMDNDMYCAIIEMALECC
jgi:hypothetical protein